MPTQPASIGNRVWFDTDQDGIQDTGETGVANVKVELYDASGNVVGTLYTDSNGNYNFTNLPPGDYYVRFSPPSGYAISPQNADGAAGNDQTTGGTNDSDADAATGETAYTTLVAGENDSTWDLGIFLTAQPASIGNRIWYDTNKDGVQDAAETTNVAGVTVVLYNSDGSVRATTVTTSTGIWQFDNLAPGDYYVQFYPPAGYAISPQDAGGNTVRSSSDPVTGMTISTTLAAGEVDLTWDLGLYDLPAQFGDRVWIESDTDGLASTGVITPVAGMVITATGANGTVYTTTTNAQGYYSFTVAAGTYTVTYGSVPSSYGSMVPSGTPGGSSESGSEGGYQQNGNPDQSHQNNTTVTVGAGEANWTVDFAFTLPAQFGDRVWIESDTDG
ncbi:MAG: carboxypeptidase regulatory-like domain-containing protein, partial [Caldilinea sp.]|nr:carboxypeptidase regulatory-like domain-containing protein [Caldilinea sp.]